MVRGMKTLGEKVTRLPWARSRTLARLGHQLAAARPPRGRSARRRSQPVRGRRDRRLAAGLVGRPAIGPSAATHPAGRQVLTSRQRGPAPRSDAAAHGEDHVAGPVDGGQGQGDARRGGCAPTGRRWPPPATRPAPSGRSTRGTARPCARRARAPGGSGRSRLRPAGCDLSMVGGGRRFRRRPPSASARRRSPAPTGSSSDPADQRLVGVGVAGGDAALVARCRTDQRPVDGGRRQGGQRPVAGRAVGPPDSTRVNRVPGGREASHDRLGEGGRARRRRPPARAPVPPPGRRDRCGRCRRYGRAHAWGPPRSPSARAAGRRCAGPRCRPGRSGGAAGLGPRLAGRGRRSARPARPRRCG